MGRAGLTNLLCDADAGSRGNVRLSSPGTGDSVKIGVLVWALHGGGAEAVATTWIDELTRRGHDLTVFTYAEGRPSEALPASVTHRHYSGRTRGGLRFVLLSFWLRRRLAREPQDVLLSVLTSSNLTALLAQVGARGPRTPVVITEHNIARHYLPLEGRAGRIQARLARGLYRRATAGTAASHAVAAEMATDLRMARMKVFVVPNPAAGRRASAPGTDTEPLPRPLRIAFVGRIVAQKDPDCFIAALAELRARGHDAVGVVVGSGPLRDDLASRAGFLGVPLRFTGWIDPWAATLDQEADCLLLASSVEGFGNVLIEAAAAGVPCVANSQALGVGDAVVPGLTGSLAISNEPGDLADAILEALSHDGGDPTSRWLDRFTVESSVDVLEKVLTRATR